MKANVRKSILVLLLIALFLLGGCANSCDKKGGITRECGGQLCCFTLTSEQGALVEACCDVNNKACMGNPFDYKP